MRKCDLPVRMTNEANQPVGASKPSVVRQFLSHLLVMPHWHKSVLAIALLIGAAGLAGHVMRWASPAPAPSTESPMTGRAIVSSDSTSTTPSDNTNPSWLARNAPWLTRTGIGCIAGFIIGWLFRAFLKLMSMLTLAGVALFGALSYFNVMNVDLTAAKAKYDSSMSWASDQAGKLKDATLAHVPASTSSVFGMFLGFRRKSS